MSYLAETKKIQTVFDFSVTKTKTFKNIYEQI